MAQSKFTDRGILVNLIAVNDMMLSMLPIGTSNLLLELEAPVKFGHDGMAHQGLKIEA
ncbi:hypothetical protein M413DRAFT_445348 [Hebeloma cylindrosporum]|uniref:Uncharacterized protein n=1 Tax=Hebeloma cylindrosporum TaxID=76867 RepID=A0A0C3CCH5_HEBCY|nr:hypothetical protein M413DRAFT_445348 [Hebeloma cylindrosporum h7]